MQKLIYCLLVKSLKLDIAKLRKALEEGLCCWLDDKDVAVSKGDHGFNVDVIGSKESVYYIVSALGDFVNSLELSEPEDWLEATKINLF